jgi:hypothetical protein
MLAYELLADAIDEYIKIGESTANFYMERFCSNIVSMYKNDYLRYPVI